MNETEKRDRGAATIRKYQHLRVYQVEAFDGQLKKFTPKTGHDQGRLKIYLNEQLNHVFCMIYSVNDATDGRQVYENVRLDEIDTDLIQTATMTRDSTFIRFGSQGEDVERRKRVEFRKRCGPTNQVYHAVEFNTDEAIEDLGNTLAYLTEAYCIKEQAINLDQVSKPSKKPNEIDSDVELIECKEDDPGFLARELGKSIREGNVQEATKFARQLAMMKANINITVQRDEIVIDEKRAAPDEPSGTNPTPPPETSKQKVTITLKQSYDDDDQNTQVEIDFDVTTTKISDIKANIVELFGLPMEKQYLIINNYSAANDDDLLSVYDGFGKRKVRSDNMTTSVCESTDDPFEVFVFSIDSIAENRDPEENVHINKKQRMETPDVAYSELAALYNQELNENTEIFACDICLDDEIGPKLGVVLKECMHMFCKECLRNHINNCDDPVVKCPFRREYDCGMNLQEREIRALLNEDEYQKFHMKSLRISEASMQNTFHCLTPDCIGFCISEDNLNFFDCPVCEKVNCLRCNTIHMGKTCKEYQDDLKINAVNDKNAKKDKDALDKLVRTKKAMYCPGCKIIVCKQSGCDWLQCPMCKIEICWATRGPRWGPNGRGDNSGGCKCDLAKGKPCVPGCGNCH